VKKPASYPQGLDKMVFELQAVDWKTQKDIPMQTFSDQFKLLKKLGAKHIGYYPDNVFHDHPKLDAMKGFFPVEVKY